MWMAATLFAFVHPDLCPHCSDRCCCLTDCQSLPPNALPLCSFSAVIEDGAFKTVSDLGRGGGVERGGGLEWS